MNKRLILNLALVVGTVVGLTGCVTPPPVAEPPAAQLQSLRYASVQSGDIAATLAGNTLVGTTKHGTEFRTFFPRYGEMRGESSGVRDVGRWHVNGRNFCATWSRLNSGLEQCFAVYRAGDELVWTGPRGRVMYTNTKMLSGNPFAL